uniref:Polyketide synthase n=1 Tax=uncultured bacterium AB_1241 TaxID=1630009 RepID=A0A0E3M0I9_9BACT|nr:polyketide synthase [uncultured bacterium AB_1241]
MIMSTESSIAIVGMACRFPGATDVTEFWANLRAGADTVSRFRPDELADPAAALDPDHVPARGVLPGGGQFDWTFFGYSPAEAATIDPQQRVFLECASAAVDDAGIDPARFPGWIGVFAGSDPVLLDVGGRTEAEIVAQVLGQDKDYLATRVAYKLGLRGPAITVQTACSTALTAVHTACQSLLGYECDAALAGGVAVSLPQRRGYSYQEGGILSRDGRCRPFDADAGGTVASEGVGVVVLRRLADAVADGDRIIAVLRGSAVNNDGGDKIGYTAPSVPGQRDVIRLGLEQAQVDPADLGYVEAHGTATRLGDPVEVQALTAAFRESTEASGYCLLGSVKANIGHTGAAAGIAGLIKAALVVCHGEVVPTPHYRRPNPLLELDATPFRIATRHEELPGGTARFAGVSSFGIGGTNVHAVLEGPPAPARRDPPRRVPRLFGLSAKSATGLTGLGAAVAERLEASDAPRLDDVAWTLNTGRRRYEHRVAVVADSADAAARELRDRRGHHAAETRKVAFLFPGQGTLRDGAAAAAHRLLPAFRADFDQIAGMVRRDHGVDLAPVIGADAIRAGSATPCTSSSGCSPSVTRWAASSASGACRRRPCWATASASTSRRPWPGCGRCRTRCPWCTGGRWPCGTPRLAACWPWPRRPRSSPLGSAPGPGWSSRSRARGPPCSPAIRRPSRPSSPRTCSPAWTFARSRAGTRSTRR